MSNLVNCWKMTLFEESWGCVILNTNREFLENILFIWDRHSSLQTVFHHFIAIIISPHNKTKWFYQNEKQCLNTPIYPWKDFSIFSHIPAHLPEKRFEIYTSIKTLISYENLFLFWWLKRQNWSKCELSTLSILILPSS